MARVHGKDSHITINSVDLSAYCDSVTFNDGTEVGETTGMGQESKSYIAGLDDATLSLSGRWDSTATTGPNAVLTAIKAGKVAVTFEFGPEGSANGAIKKSGSVLITAYNTSAPVGDIVAFTAEFQVTGDVTSGTFSA